MSQTIQVLCEERRERACESSASASSLASERKKLTILGANSSFPRKKRELKPGREGEGGARKDGCYREVTGEWPRFAGENPPSKDSARRRFRKAHPSAVGEDSDFIGKKEDAFQSPRKRGDLGAPPRLGKGSDVCTFRAVSAVTDSAAPSTSDGSSANALSGENLIMKPGNLGERGGFTLS